MTAAFGQGLCDSIFKVNPQRPSYSGGKGAKHKHHPKQPMDFTLRVRPLVQLVADVQWRLHLVH